MGSCNFVKSKHIYPDDKCMLFRRSGVLAISNKIAYMRMDLTYRILFPVVIVLGMPKETLGYHTSVMVSTYDNSLVKTDTLYKLLRWCGPKCKSLLKKHLTRSVFNKLRNKTTPFGGTLGLCIRSGCLHTNSYCAIYASDPDAYDIFAAIFDPIIKDYHKVSELLHPKSDFGDLKNLGFSDLDPSGKMIKSTRIEVRRSHAYYRFPPTSTLKDFIEMEAMTVKALKTLRGELRGKYYSLDDMAPKAHRQMSKDHFLFGDHDQVLRDAYCYNDWPVGRGIFFSRNKKFLVWVNEEDHLRIFSLQRSGNLAKVWKRLVKGLKRLEKKLTFAHNSKLGYLTFSPTNLGTALQASVHIKIPNLSKHKKFKAICKGLRLEQRGVHGKHPKNRSGVYNISNKRRMGLTEIDAVQEMRRGVEKIIQLEKKLASGEKI